MIDVPEAPPVDFYRAVHLGTELARERGLDVGPEAVAYAADRLKSKIERDVACEGSTEVLDGFLSYAFQKKMQPRRLERAERAGKATGDTKIVYLDFYKRQRERAAEEAERQAKREAWTPKAKRKSEPLKARPERPLGSPTPFVWKKPKDASGCTLTTISEVRDRDRRARRRRQVQQRHRGGAGHGYGLAASELRDTVWRRVPRLRVWYVNGEDPLDEVNLRFAAAMQHFGIKPEDVEGWLFVDTGREKDFVFARDEGKSVALAVPLVDSVVAGIEEMKIDVLILDPFVAFHLLPESDNTKINQVVRLFAEIADETNCAVELVGHTRKMNGREVEVEDARGAKALIDGARSVRTANPMTNEEGERAGLTPGEFASFFRLDNGKPNMVKRGSGSIWRRMASVEVECEDGCEDVGVCEAWRWPREAADEFIITQASAPLAPLTEEDGAVLKLIEDHIMKRKYVVYGELSPYCAPKLFSQGHSGRKAKEGSRR